MTTPTPLHRTNPEAAADLLAAVAPPAAHWTRKQFKKDLPTLLEVALEFLLADIDATSQASSAIGCRLLAACITRLKT